MRAAITSILAALSFIGQGGATPLASLDKRYTAESGGIKYKVGFVRLRFRAIASARWANQLTVLGV
jgi:hypothetical protein